VASDLQRPPTRADLNRLLIGNALTKTWPNVLVPAGIAVAGLLIGLDLLVLLPIAVVAWLALSAVTYFDGDEAQKVAERDRARRRGALQAGRRVELRTLAPPVAGQLQQVLAQEQRIREAITRADLPFSEVSDEVDTFVRAAEKTAARAELLYEYLAEQDPGRVEYRYQQVRSQADPSKKALAEALWTQLQAMRRAQKELEAFYTEMERIAVELGNIRGQLLSVSAASEGATQRQLASDVRDLREQMGAVAEGMNEALAETDAAPEPAA
jgi:outer membrane murein-binding lipoprotein Lpp